MLVNSLTIRSQLPLPSPQHQDRAPTRSPRTASGIPPERSAAPHRDCSASWIHSSRPSRISRSRSKGSYRSSRAKVRNKANPRANKDRVLRPAPPRTRRSLKSEAPGKASPVKLLSFSIPTPFLISTYYTIFTFPVKYRGRCRQFQPGTLAGQFKRFSSI